MYVKGNDVRQPSLGVDDLTCGEGEEFDFTSLTCVTKGQATTPVPSLPPATSLPPFVTTPPVMAPPAPATPTFFEKYKTPILVAGAVAAALVVGYMITPSESPTRATTPNKSRKRSKSMRKAAKKKS